MANHTSAIKSIRKNKSNQVRNRYKYKSARTIAKKLRNAITIAIQKGKFEESLQTQYRVLISKFDKLAKKKIIHKNKASNLKSKMAQTIVSLLAHSSNGKDIRFSS
ncbi:30S ribosomal protein S20 [Candidatus Uzinura diaspidicola str. ASNER]|uniref:Small ribosomal subunit protein bS20 n=1 Tax=Candidatus Uzinura diaspidicola str. ASNER TaxID=1133592 RepID=L7VKI2_9FLAO|nr:30S ribosomal protein S20 [Candidatus Uzinura diaspidicola str. ASNER]